MLRDGQSFSGFTELKNSYAFVQKQMYTEFISCLQLDNFIGTLKLFLDYICIDFTGTLKLFLDYPCISSKSTQNNQFLTPESI